MCAGDLAGDIQTQTESSVAAHWTARGLNESVEDPIQVAWIQPDASLRTERMVIGRPSCSPTPIRKWMSPSSEYLIAFSSQTTSGCVCMPSEASRSTA